jgi:VanZ family protein
VPVVYYLLTGAYCTLIFWLSSQPDPPVMEPLFPQFDKIEHMIAFGVMDALVLMGMWNNTRKHSLARLLWWPVLFTVAFGLSDELHQHFVPGRHVDPLDIVANAIGAILAQAVLLRFAYGIPWAALKAAARPWRND